MKIYCDACTLTQERGSGETGIGIVFEDKENYSEVLSGKHDSTSGEMQAIKRALEIAKEKKLKILEVFTDNEGVALCLAKFGAQFKKNNTIKIELEIRNLEKRFSKVSYFYIPREENFFADMLSRLAFGNF